MKIHFNFEFIFNREKNDRLIDRNVRKEFDELQLNIKNFRRWSNNNNDLERHDVKQRKSRNEYYHINWYYHDRFVKKSHYFQWYHTQHNNHHEFSIEIIQKIKNILRQKKKNQKRWSIVAFRFASHDNFQLSRRKYLREECSIKNVSRSHS
jgi:hypothetical protein